MEEKFKNIEFVIGIDLGHGETSAAICPIQWDTPESQLEPVKDLDMGSNRKVIPSAITIMKNGDAYIGESAFKSDHLQNAAESFLCFKKMPKDITGEDEKIMIRFMHEVYRLIRERNAAILTETNHIVAIATPSGWPQEAMNLYKQMAKEAGMPIEFVTKESRAAFVKAQHDATSGLGRCVDNGAIVFDMGSSTLDFTYMSKNKSGSYLDYGYDCGASIVEKIMYEELSKDNDAIVEFSKKYPKLTAVLLKKTREVKEQIYFDPESRVKKIVNFEELFEDEEFEDERIRIKYEPGELNELLENKGYIRKIRESMRDFQKNHIKDAKIYGVLLTGGASRMDFIKELVKECWGVDETQIYRDQDPSLTISQGVAEVARIDVLTNGMDAGLSDEIEALLNSDTIYDRFTTNFGTDIYNDVIASMRETIEYFRDAEGDMSLKTLQSQISKGVSSVIQTKSANVKEYIQQAILDESVDIRTKVENIISYYTSQGMEIETPSLKISNVKIEGLNLDDVVQEISAQVADSSDGWSDIITGAALGGVMAFLFSGPIGWIVGGGYLLLKGIFGESESEEEKKAKAMSKPLPKDKRLEVYNAIGERNDEICQQVAAGIEKALNENKAIHKSVVDVSKKVLNSYEENLRKARILID